MTDEEIVKKIQISELKMARKAIERACNKSETKREYGDESVPYLWYFKGIRDACWAIDDLIKEIEKS